MPPSASIKALLDASFPFHLVLAPDGTVEGFGKGLAKLAPGLRPGADHREHFEIHRPLGCSSPADILGSAAAVVARESQVHLRYQVERDAASGSILLLGSPRALDRARMDELGLSVRDFAPHDAYPDYLLTLSAKDLLLGETQALTANLRQLNATLEGRVGRRTEELARALEQAEAASLAKSEFLATISHELRTPLSGIAGLTHLLRACPLDETAGELVDDLDTCVRGLTQLVGDILDLARIESGAMELERIPFDTGELVSALMANLRPTTLQKGLELRVVHQVPFDGQLLGDPTRLRQVLINLLGNAIKFTPEGSVTVRITTLDIHRTKARLRFEVEDTGIGIPPEKQRLVFQSFKQADGSTTRRFGGSGLGLSISQQIVGQMDSEIRVESAEGEGSRFWFDAWFARAARVDPADPGSGEVEVEPLCVLLAEDNPLNQRVIAKVLERNGITVHLASNGRQAFEAALDSELAVDLVLMDVQMPVMDGLEATRRIRDAESVRGGPPVPIVALTANTFEEDRDRCLKAGMDDFMTKPIQIDLLLELLSRYGSRSLWN